VLRYVVVVPRQQSAGSHLGRTEVDVQLLQVHDDRAALGSIYCLATVFATIMAIIMTSTDTHIT
jgi:hypothetical protein